MVLNLKQVFDVSGEKISFDYNIGGDRLSGFGGRYFPKGADVRGSIFNRAGIVTLRGTAHFVLGTACDRCLREFEREYDVGLEHILVRSLNGEDNDDYVVVEDDMFDPDELFSSDILLQIPTKLLCSEDCKGLCPICGTDLNVSECGCGRTAV